MQMLHPHRGSIEQYMEQVEDPDRGRPSSCPQCRSKEAAEGARILQPDDWMRRSMA